MRVRIESDEEIGMLSRSFEQVIVSARNSREEIVKKVKEQTFEIIEKQNTNDLYCKYV